MQNETATEPRPKARAAIIPVTPFEQNCTLIWCEATKRAVVIDPGGDVPNIISAIEQSGVTVEKIWLTHGHLDHAGGAACGAPSILCAMNQAETIWEKLKMKIKLIKEEK